MQDFESVKITLFYCFEEKTMKTKRIFTNLGVNNTLLALETPDKLLTFPAVLSLTLVPAACRHAPPLWT